MEGQGVEGGGYSYRGNSGPGKEIIAVWTENTRENVRAEVANHNETGGSGGRVRERAGLVES